MLDLKRIIGRYYEAVELPLQAMMINKTHLLVKDLYCNYIVIDILCRAMYESYLQCLLFLNSEMGASTNKLIAQNMYTAALVSAPTFKMDKLLSEEIITFNIPITISNINNMWIYFRTHDEVGMMHPYLGAPMDKIENIEQYVPIYQRLLPYFINFFENSSGFLKLEVGSQALGILKRGKHEVFIVTDDVDLEKLTCITIKEYATEHIKLSDE